MNFKLRTFVVAALMAAPVATMACDWEVTKKTAPMTDKQMCLITSEAAKIGLSVDQDRVVIVTTSAYRPGRDFLQLRIDNNPAIMITGRGMSSDSFEDSARVALRQILNGTRLRTSYRDYPSSQEGDAEICTLPQLMRECGAPIDRIMDTRSQAEIIRSLSK